MANKKYNKLWITVILGLFVFTGCSKPVLETVKVEPGSPLAYLTVIGGEVSSFDKTPDWAPEPNPLAAADGDMLTRWSSGYDSGEQWIYFDLSKESVVSSVNINWERAYASEYKILASEDANTWQEVSYEKEAKGGSIESNFAPVKCRYIKILALSRVNEGWGVSIWETEIYGPIQYNSSSSITKEAYLSQKKGETKKKKAEELIEQLASKMVSMEEKAFQEGVVYTSWMADELSFPASDFTLVDLKETGFDTIAIMVPAYQDELDSTTVFTNDKPDGDTPTLEALEHAVNICHKLGLRVMIKLHIDPRTDEPRINIVPSEKWFDSYEDLIIKYAKFSQKNKVELFSIGTELEGTTFDAWNHRWNQIIEKVQKVYKGVLTYSANWSEYKEVPFWDKMAFIGIDAYFPLTAKKDPSLEELIAAWNTRADDIEAWLTEKGLTEKGVVLTEIGYPSADAANRQPWAATTSVEDQQEQADCLNAMFEVLAKRSWFKGFYIWQYFPQERWSPLGFTVKGKKAEEVITKWVK